MYLLPYSTKHLPGKHDQKTHGGGVRRSARQAIYRQGREAGMDVARARQSANDMVRAMEHKQHLVNAEVQLAGHMSAKRRQQTEAEVHGWKQKIAEIEKRSPEVKETLRNYNPKATVTGRKKKMVEEEESELFKDYDKVIAARIARGKQYARDDVEQFLRENSGKEINPTQADRMIAKVKSRYSLNEEEREILRGRIAEHNNSLPDGGTAFFTNESVRRRADEELIRKARQEEEERVQKEDRQRQREDALAQLVASGDAWVRPYQSPQPNGNREASAKQDEYVTSLLERAFANRNDEVGDAIREQLKKKLPITSGQASSIIDGMRNNPNDNLMQRARNAAENRKKNDSTEGVFANDDPFGASLLAIPAIRDRVKLLMTETPEQRTSRQESEKARKAEQDAAATQRKLNQNIGTGKYGNYTYNELAATESGRNYLTWASKEHPNADVRRLAQAALPKA